MASWTGDNKPIQCVRPSGVVVDMGLRGGSKGDPLSGLARPGRPDAHCAGWSARREGREGSWTGAIYGPFRRAGVSSAAHCLRGPTMGQVQPPRRSPQCPGLPGPACATAVGARVPSALGFQAGGGLHRGPLPVSRSPSIRSCPAEGHQGAWGRDWHGLVARTLGPFLSRLRATIWRLRVHTAVSERIQAQNVPQQETITRLVLVSCGLEPREDTRTRTHKRTHTRSRTFHSER